MQPHAREDEHARARITVCSFPHVSLSSRNRYRVATFLDCALETYLDNLLIRASIPAETFEEGLAERTSPSFDYYALQRLLWATCANRGHA